MLKIQSIFFYLLNRMGNNTRKNRRNMSGGQNVGSMNAVANNAMRNNSVANSSVANNSVHANVASNNSVGNAAMRSNQAGGKRKLSGYMKFAMGERKKLPKTMKFTAQGKELGKRWRALSVAQKKKY